MGRLVSSGASPAGPCAVKPIGPHTLRHAFIPAALDAGVPLRDVQEAASHADPRTTMRYDRPGLSRRLRHLHRIHLHRRRRPADLTFWAPAQARWRPESGTGRHADRRLGGGCLRIGRTADSLEIGRYVVGRSCGWPLYPVGMPFVYHLCADDFRGTTLYPLHRLRDKHPDIYELERPKWDGRESVLTFQVPYLGVAWGDTVNLAALDPVYLVAARRRLGVAFSRLLERRVVRIPVERLVGRTQLSTKAALIGLTAAPARTFQRRH
jgi:Phage integrase family